MRVLRLTMVLAALCSGVACSLEQVMDAGDPADCSDNAAGEEDTWQQAAASRPVSHIVGKGFLRLKGGVACPDDTDWLSVYGDCCQQAGALVHWDASLGTMDVELFDEQGARLPLDQPGDIVERKPGEVRLLRAEHGGRFFVRIQSLGPRVVPYTVDVLAPVWVR